MPKCVKGSFAIHSRESFLRSLLAVVVWPGSPLVVQRLCPLCPPLPHSSRGSPLSILSDTLNKECGLPLPLEEDLASSLRGDWDVRALETGSQLDQARSPGPRLMVSGLISLPPSSRACSSHCVLFHDSVLSLMLFLLPEMFSSHSPPSTPKGFFDSSDLGLKIYPFFSQAAEILVAGTGQTDE